MKFVVRNRVIASNLPKLPPPDYIIIDKGTRLDAARHKGRAWLCQNFQWKVDASAGRCAIG
jgi:hypothetical protein